MKYTSPHTLSLRNLDGRVRRFHWQGVRERKRHHAARDVTRRLLPRRQRPDAETIDAVRALTKLATQPPKPRQPVTGIADAKNVTSIKAVICSPGSHCMIVVNAIGTRRLVPVGTQFRIDRRFWDEAKATPGLMVRIRTLGCKNGREMISPSRERSMSVQRARKMPYSLVEVKRRYAKKVECFHVGAVPKVLLEALAEARVGNWMNFPAPVNDVWPAAYPNGGLGRSMADACFLLEVPLSFLGTKELADLGASVTMKKLWGVMRKQDWCNVRVRHLKAKRSVEENVDYLKGVSTDCVFILVDKNGAPSVYSSGRGAGLRANRKRDNSDRAQVLRDDLGELAPVAVYHIQRTTKKIN